MAEKNTDIPLVMEVSGDEGSQDENFDIPVIAVPMISQSEDSIEESTDIPLALEVSVDEGRQDDILDIPTAMEVNEPESCNVEVIVDINTPKFRRIFSRYLAPRTGSCHDFCKYGIKHPIEGYPANTVLRNAKSVRGNGRDLRRIIVSLAKQNKDTISIKSSQDYNAINTTDLKKVVISSPEIITPSPKRLLPSIKEVQAAEVHQSRTKLNLSLSKASSFAGQRISKTNRKKEVRRFKKQDGDGSSSSCTNSTSRCQGINISAEGDRKALMPQAVSWTPRNRVKRVAIVDKKIIGRRSLKNQSRPLKIKPDPSNSEVVEEKTLYMIEPSIKNETEGSAQNSVLSTELYHPQSSSATDNSFKNEQEADGTAIVPPLLVKKNMRHARNGTSSKNVSSSPTVFKGFKGLRPKRFGMVPRSETGSAPSSPSSSSCPSEPVHGEHSGHDDKKSEKSKVEHKIESRRKTLTDSENGDCQSRKLKFRKGRMVELQTETITPRRLKFQRVRLLNEAQSPTGTITPRRLKLQRVRLLSETQSPTGTITPRRLKFQHVRLLNEAQSPTGTITPRRLKLQRVRLLGETQSPTGTITPRRLKFQRARLLSETQSPIATITPRRLKFQRVRLLSETQSPAETIMPRRLKFQRVRLLNEAQSPTGTITPRRLKLQHVRLLSETQSPTGTITPRRLKLQHVRLLSEAQSPTGTITPRRLKFQHVRLLSETQSPKSDSRKRIIQRKEANQNGDEVKEPENSYLRQQDQEFKRKRSFRRKEGIDGKLVSSRIKSESIVLRHQDLKGKTEIQNLLNNVIEETASKLAETRKSKVKALVGAFETVISLQDAKPAATTVA